MLLKKNKNINSNDFYVVRILATWSKNLNILYVTLADTRATALSQPSKSKIVNTLHYKWEENSLADSIFSEKY